MNDLELAQIPNSYIFRLSDKTDPSFRKFAVVEAPRSRFHLAFLALAEHLEANDPDKMIEDSDPWLPNAAGARLMETNGDLYLKLMVVGEE